MLTSALDSNGMNDNLFSEEDLTEDLTVVELKKGIYTGPRPSRIFLFLSMPRYPFTLQLKLRDFFRQVRYRMIESRDFDRIHYSHTVYQKCRRLGSRAYQHVKKNLNS